MRTISFKILTSIRSTFKRNIIKKLVKLDNFLINQIKNIILKMKGQKTIRLVDIIPFIQVKFSSIVMLSSKNQDGDTFRLSGSARISNMKHMLRLRYKKVPPTTWKQLSMKYKSFRKFKNIMMTLNGQGRQEMILMSLAF